MQMKNFLTVTMVTVIAACLIACGDTKEATNQTTTPVASEQNSTTGKENETSSTVEPTKDSESNSTEPTTKKPNSGFSSELGTYKEPEELGGGAYNSTGDLVCSFNAIRGEFGDIYEFYEEYPETVSIVFPVQEQQVIGCGWHLLTLGIESVTIPNSVIYIDNHSFTVLDGETTTLKEINFTGTKEEWNNIEVCVFGDDIKMSEVDWLDGIKINFNYTVE